MPDRGRNAEPESLEMSRARQLFGFLKAFAELRVPMMRTLSQHIWTLALKDLPAHPSVTIGEVLLTDGQSAEESPDGSAPLLRAVRPKLTPAPRPPELLVPYLAPGWESATGEIKFVPERNVVRDRETITEKFEDDAARVAALDSWRVRWEKWAESERPAVEAMHVFERLYELRGRIERESERVELILGDGRLRWRTAAGTVDHPVLLQRVELHFDSHAPAFEVVDAERGPELYSALIAEDATLSPAELKKLRDELERGGYHPLAKAATSGYLRRLVQLLSPRGTFSESHGGGPAGPDPVVVRDPVLFLRTRPSGYAAAFDRVLEDLQARRILPSSLTRLVGVEPPLPAEKIEVTQSPWGEPPDVLLSKPANAEQVQIARALDRHRAIIVQGPPGTGKTHTIANLIGHLVAHGKRVLVTSHTTKALRVVRDEVVETLQPLCVAVLDSDTESRAQMQQSVRSILSRLTSSRADELERDVSALAEQRAQLNREIAVITDDLRTAREAEFRPIVVGGEAVDPAEAAKQVRVRATGNDWIPGPLEGGSPLPLSHAELQELYGSNGELSQEQDAEITGRLPDPAILPTAEMFSAWVAALSASEADDMSRFWERAATEDELTALEQLAALVLDAATELGRMEEWQRAVVAAGHSGGAEESYWSELDRQVRAAFETWEKSRPMLLGHDVTIAPALDPGEVRTVAIELGVHVSNGGSLGFWTLLLKGPWKKILAGCRVGGQRPTSTAHFRALTAHLAVEQRRSRLGIRWSNVAQPAGLPAFDAVGVPQEPVLREYSSQFESLLEWWGRRWAAIEQAMVAAGFRWKEFRDREVARSRASAPFERDMLILRSALQEAVASRAAVARRGAALRLLTELDDLLSRHEGSVCAEVRRTVGVRAVAEYKVAREGLTALARKEDIWRRRRELLARLAQAAPEWARAVHQREGLHGERVVPDNTAVAWRWRQLHQEIVRRSGLDETALAGRLTQRQVSLRETTTELIDRRAWLGQLRRTNLSARLALQGWADTVRRMGRGTGKRVPALQAQARRLLTDARDAVPVWIMPLSRVAESFDPTQRKFDVVIMDESSQSDVTGLLAWYLGDSVAVVGDHEQVSPLAVGQNLNAVSGLIAEHLDGVPNSHLYDGRASVYDMARMSFGGAIALREHFRCVPDIIGFSDELSYDFEIRPLRSPNSAPRPHVVEYVVDRMLGTERSGKTNLGEARSIVALLKATTEIEEYRGKSMGAITLLGDEQAWLIQDLAVTLVGAVELDRRRFLAGNSAQFQGDERHVVFLSMVDTPVSGRLPLKQAEAFKQRYNVAASRAKDQLWLVHSLDPEHDLQPGDLRRRLIEYVRDPGARRRAREEIGLRVESPFELAVAERLIAAGYRVQSQVRAGSYRIDMVVSDGAMEIAIECDGERDHGLDQIPADMARQAVLERAGWRFVRIRGTRYYGDPDATMDWVFGELRRAGVSPAGVESPALETNAPADQLRQSVVRRAHEIMREQGWIAAIPEVPSPAVENGALGEFASPPLQAPLAEA